MEPSSSQPSPSPYAPTWAERLDESIRRLTAERIVAAKQAPIEYNALEAGRWSRPASAGTAVNRLFMLNARQWHLEDLCCESKDDDLSYGDNKKRIEQCFKTKRPELIRTLNRHLAREVSPGIVGRAIARRPAVVRARVTLRRSRPWERVRRLLAPLSRALPRPLGRSDDRRFVRRGLERVVFFNCTHNGDLHLSREFVRHLAATIDARRFDYAHFSRPKTLRDLTGIGYRSLYDLHDAVPVEVRDTCNCHVALPYLLDRVSGTLFINTWIGQQWGRYLLRGPSGARDQVTLEGNHRMYSDLIRTLGLGPPLDRDLRRYVPTIDSTAFDVGGVVAHLSKARPGLKVLVANSDVRSRQIDNFDFSPVILSLAGRFPEVTFYVTAREPFGPASPPHGNLVFTEDVIGATGGDLNEISFLSRSCDIIVGRESGPFEFCKVRENLFDPRKTFVCFTRNRVGAFWYTGPTEARRVWSDVTDRREVDRVIAGEVLRHTADAAWPPPTASR